MSTEKRKPKVAPPPQRGESRRIYTTEYEKNHIVQCHSRRGKITQNAPGPERGCRQGGKETNTKNIQFCATERPDYPDHGPALSGGGRPDEKTKEPSQTRPKTEKTRLGHNRAARVPRPAPPLSTGGRHDKTCRNIPTQPKRLRKRHNQSIRETQTSEPRKDGKLSVAAVVRKSAVHGCASSFIYVTLDPPCKRAS